MQPDKITHEINNCLFHLFYLLFYLSLFLILFIFTFLFLSHSAQTFLTSPQSTQTQRSHLVHISVVRVLPQSFTLLLLTISSHPTLPGAPSFSKARRGGILHRSSTSSRRCVTSSFKWTRLRDRQTRTHTYRTAPHQSPISPWKRRGSHHNAKGTFDTFRGLLFPARDSVFALASFGHSQDATCSDVERTTVFASTALSHTIWHRWTQGDA